MFKGNPRPAKVAGQVFRCGSRTGLLLGEGTSATLRARWGRIVCGIEGLPLAKQLVPVYALGQTLNVGIRDTTRYEVLAPPIDHLNDA
jgi:hypothetical protein